METLALTEQDTVLIHAASGGVGFIASQLAVATGARVIGTASPRHHDKLRALGVLPLAHGDGLTGRIHEVAPHGVSAVVDLVGGDLETTLAVLAEGGRHVSIADPGVEQHAGHWIWVRPDGPRLTHLLDLAAQGSLKVDIDRTFPLEEGAEALEFSRSGAAQGKIIINVSD